MEYWIGALEILLLLQDFRLLTDGMLTHSLRHFFLPPEYWNAGLLAQPPSQPELNPSLHH